MTFSDSNVEVSGELDIKFLASPDLNNTSTTINGGGSNFISGVEVIDKQILVNPATISANGTTISGLSATFNNKDQVVYYKFYIYNNSEYDAYLKSVDFLNYNNTGENKVCTALEGTTQSLVDAACEDVHFGIVADINSDGNYLGVEDLIVYDMSSSNFASIKIPKGEMVGALIQFAYAGEVLSEQFGISGNSLLPNGDFKINFGDIKFSFSSLEG